MGRHQIGDIAHDEQLARLRTGERGRMHARIATADNQRAGFLPLLEGIEQTGAIAEVLRLKAAKTLQQRFDGWHVSLPSST